jgi:hypothetical protein
MVGRIPRSAGDGAEVEGVRLPSRPADPSRISGKSESDSRTGPESASLSFVDLFRGVGRVLGDRRIPVVGVVGSPFEAGKSRCGDTSGGSAGTVAGAAPGLLRGQRRGCCGGSCGGQDSGWRWLSRPRSRPSRPATSPGKNRRFWFGGAPLAFGNRVLPAARTRPRTGHLRLHPRPRPLLGRVAHVSRAGLGAAQHRASRLRCQRRSLSSPSDTTRLGIVAGGSAAA